MTSLDPQQQLQSLALIYLAMAHSTDDYLTDAALESVTEKLFARSGRLDRAATRDVVMESIEVYTGVADVRALIADEARRLNHILTPAQKAAVLDDLMYVAGADGVVLNNERGLLQELASCWGMTLQPDHVAQTVTEESEAESWGVLHDLAYIYLVLAHGTDNELSQQEMQVMLRRLREWQPQYSEARVRSVLHSAMESYADGPVDAAFQHAIERVKVVLPHEQRMAALHDLIQIANADGLFLDNEEDLINSLLSAWEVDPYANYGSHGKK
jgi:uncharacterized tellurite resistance protein B-like protein